jgi:hypothetical protein
MTFREAIKKAKELAEEKNFDNVCIRLKGLDTYNRDEDSRNIVATVWASDTGEVIPGNHSGSIVHSMQINRVFLNRDLLDSFIGNGFYVTYEKITREQTVVA